MHEPWPPLNGATRAPRRLKRQPAESPGENEDETGRKSTKERKEEEEEERKCFALAEAFSCAGCFIFIGPGRIYLVDYLEILRGIFNLYTDMVEREKKKRNERER